MRKKSIIGVLLAASLALSLVACSGGATAANESGSGEASVTEEGGDEADAAETEETVPAEETEAVDEAAQADTQEAVQEATQADTQEAVQEATQADTQEAADESAVTASSGAVSDEDTGDTSLEAIEDMFSASEDFSRNEAGTPDPPIVNFDLEDLEAYEMFPEETEDVSIDKAEFFKTEDGRDAIRVFFRYTNNSDEKTYFSAAGYYYYAVQDGDPLEDFVGPIPVEEMNEFRPVNPGEDVTCAHSYMLNTDSPVAFLVTVLNFDATEDIPVAVKVIDIKE